MVTRVDKKPIIYNTCFIRAIKPSVISGSKHTLNTFLKASCGYRIPEVNARQVLDDFEDIEHAFKIFGIDDPAMQYFGMAPDAEDDESIRFARMCLDKEKNIRQLMRSQSLMDEVCKIQNMIMAGVDKCYYGTEAVYQLFSRMIWNNVFESRDMPNYKTWCTETAKSILLTQSTYLFIHPIAVKDMAEQISKDMDYRVWYAWDMFKKIETVCIRMGSRKNVLAHAYYSGINKKGFEPSKCPADDFKMPLTGYCQVQEHVSMHLLLGLRYFNVAGSMYILSHDDCVNLATMAQCYSRVGMYFTQSNGYPGIAVDQSISILKDLVAHCCRLIDAQKNFSNIIRSIHILAQKEFNDMFEYEMGTNLGWEERSKNYSRESHELDPMGAHFFNRMASLALDKTDRLNTCFLYHAIVGDEMLISDLRLKVSTMTEKVRGADDGEWASFLSFVKAYTLCRFLLINKKRPLCGGDITLLNDPWVDRCISGKFTMPPRSDWGKVWIFKEFKYTEFANIWHLEAQDVAYVVRDSKGLIDGKYVSDKRVHSELLMAMTDGNILDTLQRTTPRSARERITRGGEVKEVVITTAPKAENAKPSWKKRVTFAADCEFRKMQAEFDRNCRRVMSFVRGPSLGVDQCILEKQFSDIGDATATGLNGAICSHDISAWSESMDRDRKFEFEEILINMFDLPEMINIKKDWNKINAVVNKQGCKDVVKIDNGSFQGFDGSSSTILHSMILIYCLDSARRKGIILPEVKTNMATLIDDCIALMVNLSRITEAKAFWAHLKETYLKLGFEIDDLKSIFSTIKAIYLSRRFMLGGEVPADLKVFIKAHSSYEDPLRCTLDIPGDIFGAMRGACDANGDPWYIYFCACMSTLAEIAHSHNCVMSIPPNAAAIFALAPVAENGWGFPSIISWATNDITDKRAHFNAILELNAVHQCQPADFIHGVDVLSRPACKAIYAIKSQAWRIVSYSNLFTNPFDAVREGPLKPDMLRRNAVQDMLEEVATAEPWVSLLKWNSSSTTARVRELLIQSGPLHAPTLAALVNCMPDNYRLGLVGKAIGSQSLLSLLPNAKRIILKRRLAKCATAYYRYSKAIYESCNSSFDAQDLASLTYTERTKMEREEFYQANGVRMIDHTFPDPVATFTVSSVMTGSVISPNMSSLRVWDKTRNVATRMNQLISDKGIYVPRRSGRVWEVTCEYAKGWDSVSQRVAMGLAILSRAEADGHRVEGLLVYFIKAWNEQSNITPNDTHLIAIHGSIKRLDANPGSATHPIITNRNILRGYNNKLKSALDAIPMQCKSDYGNTSHLHDFLAHETAMLCVTNLILSTFQYLGRADSYTSYQIATRQGCIISESQERMATHIVADRIAIEIMDGESNYGLLQACPALSVEIAIPTMKSSWVKMINALVDRDTQTVEDLRRAAADQDIDELLAELEADEVYYTSAVIIAAPPAGRSTYYDPALTKISVAPITPEPRTTGDTYTMSVSTMGSKFSRVLSISQPNHIIAATCIRSVVWDRIKSVNAAQLAKILYLDPDANYQLIERCSSPDFWRGCVVEVARVKGSKVLSEVVMSAFRSLGVVDLHIKHSVDIKEISQSLASYFGAHLKSVVVIVSDLVCSLAGRSSKDFVKPLVERVITHNPSLINAKLRRDHMKALVKSNIDIYQERIAKLENSNPTHRGDKKCVEHNTHARLVELRCRLYTYKSVDVSDSGSANVNWVTLGSYISLAATRVCNRINVPPSDLPISPVTLEDVFLFMDDVNDLFNSSGKGVESGWDPGSGKVGVKLAADTIAMDATMTMETKFAIAASEVAPRLHKRVIVTPKEVPVVKESGPSIIHWEGDDSDDDDIDLLAMDEEEARFAMLGGARNLPIPYWQALYTLLVGGFYSAEDVNSKLGTSMTSKVSASSIREAHLEDFTDDEIRSRFKAIEADFTSSGMAFDPDWLNRDEADAYTTDELGSVKGGFLF